MQNCLGGNTALSCNFKSPQILISMVHGGNAKWTVIVLSGQNPAL